LGSKTSLHCTALRRGSLRSRNVQVFFFRLSEHTPPLRTAALLTTAAVDGSEAGAATVMRVWRTVAIQSHSSATDARSAGNSLDSD